jgi:hypothetical protein
MPDSMDKLVKRAKKLSRTIVSLERLPFLMAG